MGKVLKFPVKELEVKDELDPDDIIKAIKDAYDQAEIEAIRKELEGEAEDGAK